MIISKKFTANGILTDPDAIVLSDEDATFGVKRTDTDEVLVAAGVAMTRISEGIYEYEFDEPEVGLTYLYSIKITYAGVDYYWTGTATGELAASGNTYATESEANAILADYLNSDSWDNAPSARRAKALREATIRIDRLNFIGLKASEDQVLEFPRGTDTEIPADIKRACAHIALSLLDGVDPEKEMEDLRLVSQGISSVRATFDPNYTPEHLMAGIPSYLAWTLLQPYLRASQDVVIQRAS